MQKSPRQTGKQRTRRVKRFSGMISWILILTVIVSLFGGISVQAEEPETEYRDRIQNESGNETPDETPNELSDGSRKETADGITGGTGRETSDEVPAETGRKTSDEIPGETEKETSDEVPGETGRETADGISGETREETSDKILGETEKETPGETRGEASDEIPDETGKEAPDETQDEIADGLPAESEDESRPVEKDGLCEHHPAHTEDCGYEEVAPGAPCMHVHDGQCGYVEPAEGRPCMHEHDADCGYAPAVEEIPCNMACGENGATEEIIHDESCAYRPAAEEIPCTHIHDASCGFAAPVEGVSCAHEHDADCGYKEATEGRPCAFLCRICAAKTELLVREWEWVDEEEMLIYSHETGLWGLGLPGAGAENPLTSDILLTMLPDRIHALLEGDTEEMLPVEWDLSAFPTEGWAGDADTFMISAVLPEGYALMEGVPALSVLLELGGGQTYTNKYINQWCFLARDGSEMQDNTMAIVTASLDRDTVIARLNEMLPNQIRGWVYGTYAQESVVGEMGFEVEKENTGSLGYEADGTPYTATIWGKVKIEWDTSSVPASLSYGDTITLTARTVASSSAHNFYVNSNTKGGGNTSTNPSILSLTFTLTDPRLPEHIAHSVDPENVVVNVFDYWVEDYGKDPVPDNGGDILQKSDWHRRPKNFDSPETDLTSEGVAFSTSDDWNKGINKGHLLIFGDGITHAGLWNKGAGENTLYGRAYAGMEGIVRPVLVDGYPVINTENAREVMLGAGDPADPDYRNHTWIRDYRLAGDHLGRVGTAVWDSMGYECAGEIHNLSDTVIGLWENARGETLTDQSLESLDYLFDPEKPDAYKASYADVDGLFQLDDDGYYYYNMRENFAEFQADSEPNGATPGTGSFILYDAPATTRTDGEQSIGNFFPFNTGAEVFNELDENGNLRSSVACARNTMNHHLGMTVEIEFRQPIDGMLTIGSKGRQPMTFEFSGDDDVWVFIDDVLVLDLGGTHSEIYGTIDFSTGEVCIGRAFDTKGIPDNPKEPGHLVTQTTLRELFEAAGVEQAGNRDVTAWRGDTFASNSDHTLRMFYLERGNYDSSIALRFNLQPLLYQQIKKVDQDGDPLSNIVFEMYPAKEQDGQFVRTSNTSLATLETGSDGTAPFIKGTATDINGNPLPFDFAEHYAQDQTRYYILKEIRTPDGYRPLPVDVVLEYHPDTTMVTVANRWVTGAFGSFTSTITGNTHITYGAFDPKTGSINQSNQPVSQQIQEEGLVVAIPMVRIGNIWKALYGGNVEGFHAVTPASRSVEDWRKAALKAVLYQCVAADADADSARWYLEWDTQIHRLTGFLNDLPGRADRYQLISGKDADMKMVYAIIDPQVFTRLFGKGNNLPDSQQYQALAEYVTGLAQTSGISLEQAVQEAVEDIYNVTEGANGRGISFLNVDQFVRNFRSQVYIPNEQRELRVWKVNQNGEGINGVTFSLYEDPACTRLAAEGTTARVDGRDGVLVFAPYDKGDGYSVMAWASDVYAGKTDYYLKETAVPAGSSLQLNPTVVPVHVGIYSIYADAGVPGDGITVMGGVGKLAQTMIQYASDEDVEITLRDITAVGQVQESGKFSLTGWQDMKLDGTEVLRSMDLHYGRNALPTEYGLHDEDGGDSIYPYFVTDTGFVRARVEQNGSALENDEFQGAENNSARCEDLGDTDLTSLFSLLNIVVVTDRDDSLAKTGRLTVSKTVTSANSDSLTDADYTRIYEFTVELTDAGGTPLPGDYPYYYYGEDKTGVIANNGRLYLHHDESVTILGLPEGTECKVTEEGVNPDHVNPTDGIWTGTISADTESRADFTNTAEKIPEILKISKKVESDSGELTDADRTRQFEFTVRLTDAKWNPLRGSYSYSYTDNLSAIDGAIENNETIRLQDGQTLTIFGLPAGAHYTVTETPVEGFRVSEPVRGTASGEMIKDQVAEAEFINKKKGPSGTLSISKTVTGQGLTGPDHGIMFPFTITFTDADGNAVSGAYPFYMDGGSVQIGDVASGETLYLRDGESVQICELPAGTRYTVTETPVDGWSTVAPASGTAEGVIVENEEAKAAFINEKNKTEGILRVTKRVVDEDQSDAGLTEEDRTRLFRFAVTLTNEDGKALTGRYPYYMNGSETLTGNIFSGGILSLCHGQSVEIRGLPAGTCYTVVETPAKGWDIAMPASGRAEGTIGTDTVEEAAFVNRRNMTGLLEPGALLVTKRVTGENLTDADRSERFLFTVELTDADGKALAGSYLYYLDSSETMTGELTNGGTLALHHGESAIFRDLPEGTRYSVTEIPVEGWEIADPSSGTVTGTITSESAGNAAFVNRKVSGEEKPVVPGDSGQGSTPPQSSGQIPWTGDRGRPVMWVLLGAVILCGLHIGLTGLQRRGLAGVLRRLRKTDPAEETPKERSGS